jgi:hypothetical protein
MQALPEVKVLTSLYVEILKALTTVFQSSCAGRSNGRCWQNKVDWWDKTCIRVIVHNSTVTLLAKEPREDDNEDDKENQGVETQGQQPPQHS